MKELEVVKLSDDDRVAGEVNVELGISTERAKELEKLMRKSLMAYDSLTDVLVEMSKQCKHANELVFVGMQVGSWYAQKHNPLTGLEDLLKHLGRDKKE